MLLETFILFDDQVGRDAAFVTHLREKIEYLLVIRAAQRAWGWFKRVASWGLAALVLALVANQARTARPERATGVGADVSKWAATDIRTTGLRPLK